MSGTMKQEEPLRADIRVTTVGGVQGWDIQRAEKRNPKGELDVRWVASFRRQEKPKDVFHQWQTDVVVATDREDITTFGYRTRDSKVVSNLGKPDPIPVDVIATLLGLRDEYLNFGKIIIATTGPKA